jgi:hypothetical protein
MASQERHSYVSRAACTSALSHLNLSATWVDTQLCSHLRFVWGAADLTNMARSTLHRGNLKLWLHIWDHWNRKREKTLSGKVR